MTLERTQSVDLAVSPTVKGEKEPSAALAIRRRMRRQKDIFAFTSTSAMMTLMVFVEPGPVAKKWERRESSDGREGERAVNPDD